MNDFVKVTGLADPDIKRNLESIVDCGIIKKEDETYMINYEYEKYVDTLSPLNHSLFLFIANAHDSR